ncbi:hypothetical protein [Streptomyces prunicolor]|uniref:hypothetical protein n=1 Tax=Streptomyces prunicolor TaxID=67348 RepID=UPI000369DE06|nr:hypothetical protein [Streptomyces prunicolor]
MTPPEAEPDKNVVALVCEGWHWCVLAGLTTPQAAVCTDGAAIALALLACARGRARTAATLSATAAACTTAATLLH